MIGKTQTECQLDYDMLCNLLLSLGSQLSQNKLVPPCQQLNFVGVLFNPIQDWHFDNPIQDAEELHTWHKYNTDQVLSKTL